MCKPGSILTLSTSSNCEPGLSGEVTPASTVRYLLLLSGWLLGEDRLRGQIALAEVGAGKGRIVLFGFRPQHRGQSWATLPFIWNALSTATINSTE